MPHAAHSMRVDGDGAMMLVEAFLHLGLLHFGCYPENSAASSSSVAILAAKKI